MTYIAPVKWDEAQAVIREQMKGQPRGYQAQLAKRIGKTPGFVNHLATGHKAIPLDLLDPILESLNLTYDVVLTHVPKPDGDA